MLERTRRVGLSFLDRIGPIRREVLEHDTDFSGAAWPLHNAGEIACRLSRQDGITPVMDAHNGTSPTQTAKERKRFPSPLRILSATAVLLCTILANPVASAQASYTWDQVKAKFEA